MDHRIGLAANYWQLNQCDDPFNNYKICTSARSYQRNASRASEAQSDCKVSAARKSRRTVHIIDKHIRDGQKRIIVHVVRTIRSTPAGNGGRVIHSQNSNAVASPELVAVEGIGLDGVCGSRPEEPAVWEGRITLLRIIISRDRTATKVISFRVSDEVKR